jgi:predicted phosphodiesterase
MKIAIGSDIHLEFGTLPLIDAPEADVLVLAGDILVAFELTYLNNISKSPVAGLDRAKCYFDFITKCCRLYKHVIFLMGNHEHYHGEFNSTARIIKETFDHIKNFYLLENSVIKIDDVVFIGATLWTNMNGEDDKTIEKVHKNLNDYVNILFEDELGIRDFEPEDTIEEHRKSLTFLKRAVCEHLAYKVIVITHHAPSKLSKHPKMRPSNLLNGAYMSDLDNFIEIHSQIKYWIHGHTHKKQNYIIGETNIVCNPRGYLGIENLASKFEFSIIEL